MRLQLLLLSLQLQLILLLLSLPLQISLRLLRLNGTVVDISEVFNQRLVIGLNLLSVVEDLYSNGEDVIKMLGNTLKISHSNGALGALSISHLSLIMLLIAFAAHNMVAWATNNSKK